MHGVEPISCSNDLSTKNGCQMKNFSALLDRYLVAKGYQTDSELARAMGVSRQYVHKLRHLGKATDDLCIEIGRTIGEHPAAVMVARNADLEGGEKGEIWADFLAGMQQKIVNNQAIAAIKDYRNYLFAFQIKGLAVRLMALCQ